MLKDRIESDNMSAGRAGTFAIVPRSRARVLRAGIASSGTERPLDAPIKRDLSGMDARLIVQGDPLITTMLNQQGTGDVAIAADVMIGRHRRPQLVV